MTIRTGLGFDVHRLVEGRPCILGGVELPHPTGPDGHSDGDAVLHAICDAVLGAAGLDDLGSRFPDTEPEWKDAAGSDFQVFSSDATPIGSLAGEERTNVMHVVPELDDSLLRTIDQLPVDAFLVSLADAASLTVSQLMRLARVRGVTSRWVLVQLAALPTKEELELLRDAGVGGIVVVVDGLSASDIQACKQALLELPREPREHGKGHSFATVPQMGANAPARRAPEPEPDDDDWEDE